MSVPDFIRDLLDPTAHPDRPKELELRQTHISWLILTDRFVYKIKKPLDLGFLDFSTPAERLRFCHEEVRLNRRLSPDVYLGVVELRRIGGQTRVGGVVEPGPATPDDVIDYGVKMRRLPANQWLTVRLRAGTVDAETIERIGRRIAEFHMGIPPVPDGSSVGRIETVRFNTEENFAQVAPFVGRTLSREQLDAVQAYTRTFLDVRAGLFRRREAEGRVRDGHGDLHAAQICLENGISFIDCIEFDERFRVADVAADVAFLAMDLDRHGRVDLRRRLVDVYMAATGDRGVEGILPFYMTYRAFTRGKVESLRFSQLHEGGEGGALAARQSAEGYFDLARGYVRPAPVLIITSGLMGSGKSTVAEALSARLACPWIRTDAVRKELAGLEPGEAAREDWQQGIYGPDFHRGTYDEVHRRAASTLEGGQCAIIDGSYRERRWRDEARAVAERAGVPFLAVDVVTPPTELRRRLEEREKGRGVSDGRLELLEEQIRTFEPLTEIPPAAKCGADGAAPIDDVALRVLEAVYRRGLGAPA